MEERMQAKCLAFCHNLAYHGRSYSFTFKLSSGFIFSTKLPHIPAVKLLYPPHSGPKEGVRGSYLTVKLDRWWDLSDVLVNSDVLVMNKNIFFFSWGVFQKNNEHTCAKKKNPKNIWKNPKTKKKKSKIQNPKKKFCHLVAILSRFGAIFNVFSYQDDQSSFLFK